MAEETKTAEDFSDPNEKPEAESKAGPKAKPRGRPRKDLDPGLVDEVERRIEARKAEREAKANIRVSGAAKPAEVMRRAIASGNGKKKIYYSKALRLAIKVEDGGFGIGARGGQIALPDRWAQFENQIFSTGDPEVIAVMDKHPERGRRFWPVEEAREVLRKELEKERRNDSLHKKLLALEAVGAGHPDSVIPGQLEADREPGAVVPGGAERDFLEDGA